MLAQHKYKQTLTRKSEWFVDPKRLIETAKDYKSLVDKSKFVYFLIDLGVIVYVGMSDTVQNRLHAHTKDKTFTHVAWIRVNAKDQKYIEAYYIATLRPKYNKFVPIRGVTPAPPEA